MSIVGWIGRLSFVLTMSAGAALCDPALSADMSVKTDHLTKTDQSSGRLCTDLNGKTFRWNWPNAPFAAVCTDDEGREAKPSPPAQKPMN
jgi:hypothetical protein